MKILGVIRVRNEAHIIQSTLDHMAQFCKRIAVLDEASTDDTFSICVDHPAVVCVTRLAKFETDPNERRRFESWGRQRPLDNGLQAVPDAEWVLYMDADERLVFDLDTFDWDSWDAASFRLWDYYITASDVEQGWEARKWIGPEYRDIPMLWRVTDGMRFSGRVLNNGLARINPHAGDVRHYGKAISVAEWESTCEYYTKYQPEFFRAKWERRKGKAIHTTSSFGNTLIPWSGRALHGVLLSSAIEAHEKEVYS